MKQNINWFKIMGFMCIFLFIYLMIDFIKYPEYYITTWKYQLKNDILADNKEAINLYEDTYVTNKKDLFSDNFNIRDTYLVNDVNLHTDTLINESDKVTNIIKEDTDLYIVTAYCHCVKCCGKSNGITASGVKAVEGVTIAADTKVLPFGTKVIIDGNTYTVQDRGGAIRGNRIDIYFNSHEKALQYGKQLKEVIILE